MIVFPRHYDAITDLINICHVFVCRATHKFKLAHLESSGGQSGRRIVADDGVRLTAARLAVGADANVVTVESRLNQSLPAMNAQILVQNF